MAGFEYKVVPAPTKGVKAKGLRSAQDRFANALQVLMNDLGAQGWEYQRADTLPSTERAGLTGTTTVWRHVLVFRRMVQAAEPAPVQSAEPLKLEDKTRPAAPAPDTARDTPDAPETPAQDTPPDAPDTDATGTGPEPRPAGQPGATSMLRDNGVEETSDVAGPSTSLSTLASSRKGAPASDV